jgi:SAM-dependent methyltransferase
VDQPYAPVDETSASDSRLGHHVDVTRDPWSAAEPYELFMGRWSRLLAAEVVAWLDPPPGLRWLDVGCGTGALSEAVLTGTAPKSVVGVDMSAAYVAAATARVVDERMSFRVGDGAALPLPDSSADQVVSGLVLNFVPDPIAAVREMRRVLVPGGRATVYVWDYSSGMQMLRHFWDAAVAEDPGAAALDEGARFPLCRSDRLRACFSGAGLDDLDARPVEVLTVFNDFSDYWAPFLGGQGPAPGYCAGLPQEARDRLSSRLLATLPQESDGTIRLSARAWAISGTSA